MSEYSQLKHALFANIYRENSPQKEIMPLCRDWFKKKKGSFVLLQGSYCTAEGTNVAQYSNVSPEISMRLWWMRPLVRSAGWDQSSWAWPSPGFSGWSGTPTRCQTGSPRPGGRGSWRLRGRRCKAPPRSWMSWEGKHIVKLDKIFRTGSHLDFQAKRIDSCINCKKNHFRCLRHNRRWKYRPYGSKVWK